MSIRRFLLAGLVPFALLGTSSLAGKGGGNGKPGGDEPPPDPAISYSTDGQGAGLFVMNLDGSNQTEIFSGHVRGQSFSPDGSEVAFLSDELGNGVHIVGVDGSNPRFVAEMTTSYLGGGVSWSSHGWIAFTDHESGSSTTNDVFLVRPDGTGLVNLTGTPGGAEFGPTWNATGDKLAVKRYNVPGTQTWDPIIVYTVEIVDGVPTMTAETDIVNVAGSPLADEANVANADFARTSDRLVVQATLSGESTRSLWILDLADPANPVRLTSAADDEIQPTWCDDDTRIVFNAPFRSNWVLWSMDAATGGDEQRLGNRFQGDHACRP